MTARRRVAAFLVLLLLFGLAAPAGAAPAFEISVLGNRADLVSGGDALVEVVLPAGVAPATVRVRVNGADATAAFAVRENGRFMGVVEGLADGDNDVQAFVDPASGATFRPRASLTITNHPIGGPVFSGAQLQPWVCARPAATPVSVTVPGTSLSATVNSRASGLRDGPLDAQCNATTRRDFFYQPTDRQGGPCLFTNAGANRCFEPYDVNNPPADDAIANFVNDRGDTVKSIIVLERGTMDRAIYQLVTFYDPTRTQVPWAPQRGWNGKLLWRMGASASVSRFQTAPGTSVFNDNALRRGFMVASSSFTDHGTNSNDTFGAEMMVMVKEHIAENYGPIRYTIGDGCSGGSIMQHSISGAYPGLLNAIQPNCSYPDTMTTFIEIADCGVLQNRYYATADGSTLTSEQRAVINGHNSTGFCNVWITSFLNAGNPSVNGNCGSGWPAALTYSTTSSPPRPDGVRCTGADHDASMVGTFVDTDGNRKANQAGDNEGVQYGLKALQASPPKGITAEQFVRLNEGVGGYTPDLTWTGPSPAPGTPAPRHRASADALHTYYSGGLVSDGRQLAKLPIIDLRGDQNPAGDIHMNWRAWAVRNRLDTQYGDHDNQLIWAYTGNGGAGTPGAALLLRSFLTLDQWLTNMENDPSERPIEQKVRANKPAGATDMCLTNTGATEPLNNVGLGTPACPVTFQGSPRQVAGGPLAENVFKCQLKPLDFSDPAYGGVAFTLDQQARLLATFPTGVCDWSKPGVSQVPEDGWTTFAAGPGGQPLGDAPTSVAVNQPPDARCRSITVSARGDVCSAVASVNNGSSDPDGDAVTVKQLPSGPYGLGATGVTLTASDPAGLSSTCTSTVTVVDTTPPVIAGVTATPNSLWPPNHKMVAVSVSPKVADVCDAGAARNCRITSVSSNEGSSADWQLTGALSVNLRAERSGAGGNRVYNVAVECADASGNRAQGAVAVAVPHDQGK